MRRSEFKLDLKSSRAVSQACVQIIQLVASYTFQSARRLSFIKDMYIDFREYSKSYLLELRGRLSLSMLQLEFMSRVSHRPSPTFWSDQIQKAYLSVCCRAKTDGKVLQ